MTQPRLAALLILLCLSPLACTNAPTRRATPLDHAATDALGSATSKHAARGLLDRPLPPLPRSLLADAKGRNVVLITVDTLRADYLSIYGNTRVMTPNVDRLAASGVLFRQAFAQATTTTPSHASMMSSLYLQDHNVYTNFDALGDEVTTVAEVLRARGYATYAIVNMAHLNPEIAHLDQGFSHFERSGPRHQGAAATLDHFLAWLDNRDSAPFFAWIHLADVHTPYKPPSPYDRLYYGDDERDPGKQSLAKIWPLLPQHMSDHPFFKTWLEGITDAAWVIAQYQGAVTYVDDQLGRLLQALEERQLLNRTALIFTSDHGESLGEHEMYFVHTGLYEPTARVPLLLYFPDAPLRGKQVRQVVELVDVAPTLLEYLQLAVPPQMRGRSLWPLMRDEAASERTAFIEHAGRNLVALRSPRYKYIRHLRTNALQPAYPFQAGREELYDLLTDPGEQHDLSTSETGLLRAFRQQWEGRAQAGHNLPKGRAAISPAESDVLRSLGYVQ